LSSARAIWRIGRSAIEEPARCLGFRDDREDFDCFDRNVIKNSYLSHPQPILRLGQASQAFYPALTHQGRFFPGQDLSATASGQGQPPNVSADVSSTQNAEFINFLGLWVWNKPTLPIVSPPTPIQKISLSDFWCDSYGVNGQPLNGCVNGQETFGTFGDTQIGYDATLGRWIATTNASDGTSHIGVLYFAVSESSTLSSTGGWNKWWASTCNSSPYTAMDEPLLGWSNSVVVVDVTCFQGPANEPTFGPDNLFVISNVTITSVSQTLPTPMVAPCAKMTPARDEQGTLSNAYLLTSIVPNSGSRRQHRTVRQAPQTRNPMQWSILQTLQAYLAVRAVRLEPLVVPRYRQVSNGAAHRRPIISAPQISRGAAA
jgi:hypothetical protein